MRSLTTNIKVWQLRDQDPLSTYIKGRTVLIGDAAHAMTPHQAQIGTQLKMREGLHALLGEANVGRDSVPKLLKDYDRVRRPRASQIQNTTRQAHHQVAPEQIYSNSMYNWTYPGMKECLRRLNAGEVMIEV